jgi:hypothetical protein
MNQYLTFKDKLILYTLAFFLLFLFLLAVYKFTDYLGRMKQYNYHMCVEVYGLNEECK